MTNSNYWRDSTVVVTGGTGFIGSHFVGELLSSEANVICVTHSGNVRSIEPFLSNPNLRVVELDLLNTADVGSLIKFASSKVDAVIHCAGLDGNTQFKLDFAAEILDVNLRITSNLLNACRGNQVSDIVMVSSTEIYSAQTSSPIVEEDDYRHHISYSENGYNLSKILGEIMANLYRKQFNMNIYTPRPTNVYGPRDNFRSSTSRVIPAMLAKISAGEEIEIWGDGTQERSFMYVTDLVRAVMCMVESKRHFAMNFATRESISIHSLAQELFRAYGTKERVHLDMTKPTGVKKRDLDVSKMYDVIDFAPRSIEIGVRTTVDWFKSDVVDLTDRSAVTAGETS